MKTNLWTVGLALLCALVLSAPVAAQTLVVPLPSGCNPTIVAGVVKCQGAPDPGPQPPPAPPPIPPAPPPAGGFAACAAAGYTAQLIEMQYPLGANQRVDTSYGPRFGNNDALVIRFKAPAYDPSGAANFSIVYRGGAPDVRRVGGLSTVPCWFPVGFSGPSLPVGTASSALNFRVSLNNNPIQNTAVLQPLTDYYITVVNRNGFGVAGTPSCYRAGAPFDDCAVFIDAN